MEELLSLRTRRWVTVFLVVVAVLVGVLIWLSLGDGLMECEMTSSTQDGVERVMPVCG
jgi:hypothetical protein